MRLLTLLMVAGGLAGQTHKPDAIWPDVGDIEHHINTPTLTKTQLRFALISRVLTAEEMAEVERLGEMLFLDEGSGGGFHGPTYAELNQRLLGALLQQFKLRLAAEQAKREPKTKGWCWVGTEGCPAPPGIPFIVPGGCEGAVCW